MLRRGLPQSPRKRGASSLPEGAFWYASFVTRPDKQLSFAYVGANCVRPRRNISCLLCMGATCGRSQIAPTAAGTSKALRQAAEPLPQSPSATAPSRGSLLGCILCYKTRQAALLCICRGELCSPAALRLSVCWVMGAMCGRSQIAPTAAQPGSAAMQADGFIVTTS